MKKIISCILSLATAASAFIMPLTALEPAEPDSMEEFVPVNSVCDIDGDGKITVAEAVNIIRYIAGWNTLPWEQVERADVDNDGKITVNDAVAILRTIVDPSADPTPTPADPTQQIITADSFKYQMKYYKGVSFIYSLDGDAVSELEAVNTSGSPCIYRIETPYEAYQLIEATQNIFAGDGSSCSDFEAVFSEYDEAFFENSSLILILEEVPCIGWDVDFKDFAFDGTNLTGKAVTLEGKGGFTAVATNLCVLELNGRLPEDTKFDIVPSEAPDPNFVLHSAETAVD